MRLLIAALSIVLSGCVTKRDFPNIPPPPAGMVRGPSYVDLEAGWRVRVITPKLKSGGFLPKTTERQESGNTITLRAGDEFLGYETAVYGVAARKDTGIRISMTGTEFNRNGMITYPAKSFAPRLQIPGRFRLVRLLYMQKVSDADHAMAVLAAPDSERLAALTRRVQALPQTACRSNRNEYCEWIPAGVAVRPERPLGHGWAPI